MSDLSHVIADKHTVTSSAVESHLGIYGKSTSPFATNSDGKLSLDPIKERNKLARAERDEEFRRMSIAITRVRRFALKKGAATLLPGSSVATCLRCRQKGRDHVELRYSQKLQQASFGGLQTCASVWVCPVCSAKITERRRIELSQALEVHTSHGGIVLMIVYTLPHKLGERCGDVIERLAKARSSATSGKRGQAIYRKYGVIGSIRALEITHGKAGWHPHIHDLLFVSAGVDLVALLRDLKAQWNAVMVRLGYDKVNPEHGVHLSKCDLSAAEYVQKFGKERTWGPEHELSKQPAKSGRRGNMSPIDLLAAFTYQGDLKAAALWREYATDIKGRRQLFWSKGLRQRLLPGAVEKTDEEIAEETDEQSLILCLLTLRQWRIVLQNDAEAMLLDVASNGDLKAVQAFLQGLDGSDSTHEELKPPRARLSRPKIAIVSELRQEAEGLGIEIDELLAWSRGGLEAIATEKAPVDAAYCPSGQSARPSALLLLPPET